MESRPWELEGRFSKKTISFLASPVLMMKKVSLLTIEIDQIKAMKNRVQRLIITTNRLQIWTKIPKNISKYLNPLIQFIFASITLPLTCLAPFCDVKFLQTRLYTGSCFSSNTICSSFFSPFKHEQLPVMSPMCCGQVSTD